ncbi:uncharacterized protein LOC126655275 [Mercurialis annua]|uniref:uncharacterized protein LOC126655275 n=1 Tax=Mercurialis annua TaxID=3986 RepID=UPI00215EF310|nr:uncharacterized protein LOC126655275 [Mercurialis annua]
MKRSISLTDGDDINYPSLNHNLIKRCLPLSPCFLFSFSFFFSLPSAAVCRPLLFRFRHCHRQPIAAGYLSPPSARRRSSTEVCPYYGYSYCRPFTPFLPSTFSSLLRFCSSTNMRGSGGSSAGRGRGRDTGQGRGRGRGRSDPEQDPPEGLDPRAEQQVLAGRPAPRRAARQPQPQDELPAMDETGSVRVTPDAARKVTG